MVTPTYYVFFTSSTIVTSSVLFQGFKGSPIQIITVIMGFLTICSGVVLLQLSKSAKDVPDAAVFKGDLDQVRTVAEVEEPEYEPRADAIRGGSAILRSLSKARSNRELQEAHRIKEEHMQVIGEGETVEFDGIRRRKTVLDPSRPPTRTGTMMSKSIHPPLGMTHFPEDSDDDDNISFHPGFFERLRSRGKSNASRTDPTGLDMKNLPPIPTSSASSHQDPVSDKDFAYKDAMHQDTAYKPHDAHIQFVELPPAQHSDGSLSPPKPPPHMAKRQFSFQNVFHRNRGDSEASASGSARRPVSRSSRKNSRDGAKASPGTEEERLGLVKGDSRVLMRIPSDASDELNPPGYTDEWGTGGRRAESPSGGSPGRLPIADAHQGAYRGVDTHEVEDPRYERSRKGPGGAY